MASVAAVSRCEVHAFSKKKHEGIHLVAGLGVDGDAHQGERVQHRSRVARDPTQPNLRQVHLIHIELYKELEADGFNLNPGNLGENITTRGINLLALPTGTILQLGSSAVVEVTGLRNPCRQLDHFLPGLMTAVLARDRDGGLIRKAGIMGIVLASGTVVPDDSIALTLPLQPHRPLSSV